MLVPDISKLVSKSEQEENEIIIDDINTYINLYDIVDLENEKERKALIKKIESLIRNSTEYKKFIGFLRNNLNLNKCTFHPDVNCDILKKTKIEFHHYPFTLYEIVDTVVEKQSKENPIINPFDVAEEVMELHYDLKIGLVPLSKTLHELAHSGKKFINLKYVKGSYLKFISLYNVYINDNLIDNWNELKALSEKEDNGELTDNILEDVRLKIIMENIEEPKSIKIETNQIA